MPSSYAAHLKRCVYSTRDAGAIWEDCCADALVGLGFVHGMASPCCFQHPSRNLCVVVHGDDFTCLGPRLDILWYEDSLAERFEIKRRGQIGESEGCVQEIRILNRILRLTADGLRYEADPRHSELLVKALDLTDASSVLTPGVKGPNDSTNYDARLDEDFTCDFSGGAEFDDNDDGDEVTAVLAVSRRRNPNPVTFSDDAPTVHEVRPYSEVYGLHPRLLVATHFGWKRVSEHADPYTGKTRRVVTKRSSTTFTDARRDAVAAERKLAVNAMIWYGAAWEGDDLSLEELASESSPLPSEGVCVVRTPSSKPKHKKRAGAKAVKKLEMAGNLEDLLKPEDATTFRGLSARGTFLAQDRADISFATRELCREFAAPVNSSPQRLKRLGRFLVGARRLVYH